MRKHKSAVVAVLMAFVFAAVAIAADWPQWRGPQRDGISKETGLLKQWPENGPPELWRVADVGDGYSTPAIVGDTLYLMGNEGTDNEFVQARSVKDGSQIWSVRVGKVGPNDSPQYPGARSTPTVDGDLLYALGSNGDLVCLTRASGKIRWQKNLREDFGGEPGKWAYAESPLVDGDKLVCTPGGKEATIVALNKKTGDVIWKSTVPGGDKAAYASAIIVNTGGVRQYVQFLQNGVVGVQADNGKFLWRYERTAKGSPANIPTPAERDGFVYTATGLGGGGLVKLKIEPGEITADEVYFSKKLPTAIGGVVLVGDSMYGTSSQSILCVDFKSGEVKWQTRGTGAGSILFADGNLYVHGEDGKVTLVEATPEAYRVRGSFSPNDPPERKSRESAWAYPVVANGRLYIRDKNVLWCYDVHDLSAVR
jgi:outer membrane protein assembly factor BamB